MCGILAVFCNTKPKDLKQILLGGKYLTKRGPDSCHSIVRNDGIYIFRRLAINDTSDMGSQPIVNKNIIMMCNGEIYNYKELINEYELLCESNSDCEVIIRLYEKIGFTKMVEKLDGVFSIVLVDGNNCYMARDKIGVRPLYFGLTAEKYLAVASVPNALQEWCYPVTQFPLYMLKVRILCLLV